eukprot:jgi/Hompol1/1783/HPOL_002760-RA
MDSKLTEFIFIGTGTSGSVPNIHCLTKEPPTCEVCLSAIRFDAPPEPRADGKPVLQLPHFSKNRRRNTSGMLRYMHSDGRERNILIDCGKTFFDAALTWFVEYRLRTIDAVILTHGHADAIMGLDDLRQFTIGGPKRRIQEVVHIYLSQETMEVVARAFPYLVHTEKATGGGEVPSVQFHVIPSGPSGPLPFTIEDELHVIPFEVEHGKSGSGPYMSLGFRFNDLSYISDVNAIPEQARQIIQGSKVLIIDALSMIPHPSHFSFEQAIDQCLFSLTPGGKGFFVGMSHGTDHDQITKMISDDPRVEKAGVEIFCAYDGLRLPLQSRL